MFYSHSHGLMDGCSTEVQEYVHQSHLSRCMHVSSLIYFVTYYQDTQNYKSIVIKKQQYVF